MITLIQLQNGYKSFGKKELFAGATFAVNSDEHIGVIGPNGAGKTTLFKILTGQEDLDSGEIIKSNSLRLGYLAQYDNWKEGQTVSEYLSQEEVRLPLWKLKSLSVDLGITNEMFERPVEDLSGGYRMRCKLLYLIGQEPNLMLLDEPTNYLDLETTLVLEKFLQSYDGAFLLISHDREFLRRTTDHIVEVEAGEITKYNGNIDDYFEQKTLLRTQLEAQAMSQQKKREQVLEFVSRFGAKASKAKQAQSRLKSLEKMESIELKELPVSASIQIPSPSHAGKVILQLQDANLGYGDKVILKSVNYILNNGDHVAVVGLNGAGKSTFLKTIAQVIPTLSGSVSLGYQASVGYYAQHVAENLDPNKTVLEEMRFKAHPSIIGQDVLNMAGSLLFSGEDVRKKISVLSGGEKSRVALGQILLQKAPCLILDEPTNHLDFQTVEALTQALKSYAGTVVVVSHDRSFIKRVGNKILEVNGGQLNLYPGTYEEYVWSLEMGILSERKTTKKNDNKKTDSKVSDQKKEKDVLNESLKSVDEKKRNSQELRNLQKALDVLEKKIEKKTIEIADVNLKITQSGGDELQKMVSGFLELQKELEIFEQEWLVLTEKIMAIETSKE